MTEKEAIKVIRKELHSYCESSGIDCFNSDCENCKIIVAYEKAIIALEKQIPKKPVEVRNEIVCPTCKTLVGSSPYCRYCGQALDWGEESCGS